MCGCARSVGPRGTTGATGRHPKLIVSVLGKLGNGLLNLYRNYGAEDQW